MKNLYSFVVLLFLILGNSGLRAQECTYTMSMFSQLSSGQTDSESATLAGNLTSVTFNLNFTGTGASYPADMMVYLYAPNGECIVWGGWNIPPTGGCTNVGTGFNNSWPANWSTTVNGFYTYTLNTNAFGLNGSGTWSVTIQNAWTTAAVATYDLDIIFNGICEGDCFIPSACNYDPFADLVNNDLCIFADDLYSPPGVYDCDGNCLLDFDGDGVCNELEIPGCQEPWACNYNPQATDPAPPADPCSYPESNEVDCQGNSLLPQFLAQPQDVTVSCDNVPESPPVSAQPAPAALAYYGLFPESCYDAMDDVEFSFTETLYPGNCPGNYTIDRYWVITDCNGLQNAILQTITVVDNLPPVIVTDLTPDTLDCNDPVYFTPLDAQDECGGDWSVSGEPSFVFLPGDCVGESVQKKYTTITDQCGNGIEVEQVLLIEDNDPPFWLEEPLEQIFTDNIDGEAFDVPVADDVCSNFEVDVTTTYNDGLCPLSVVLTRTFVATDQCGNTSAPFIQTITEETDLEASLASVTPVTCHNGNDGTAEVEFSGGVAPYTVDWNGYNPASLPAGEYSVQVLDANLCSVLIDEILITQPAPFSMDLQAIIPECSDPESGQIVPDVNGGTGNVSIDWNGINPNAVAAGTYNAVATDEAGCVAYAEVTVALAEIPESLELNGDTEVVQGDSAAYYYEYTLGSTYEWWYSGALEEQALASFAISVLWDTTGFVCVQETNLEGCVGDSVCLDVTVLDDVWSVGEVVLVPRLMAYPNPAFDIMTLSVPAEWVGHTYTIFNALGARVDDGRFEGENHVIDVEALSAGQYMLKPQAGLGITFQVVKRH
ncbi:MAG: hypothetical protein CBC05_01005 [Crocinitomicaceae bacterium TMED45]|nr:MAG: hypothetical protein CBC05_01005 [Crocinitomicaceae bacterium TMED45]